MSKPTIEPCAMDDSNFPDINFNYGEGCALCPFLNKNLWYCYIHELHIEDLASMAKQWRLQKEI